MTAPATFNLADLWESVADEVPDRTALVCGDRRLTFAELEERSTRLAHRLLDLGVGPGDHVGLHLMNGTEYVEGMLAAWKIRAVPINVNYRYVEDELRYLFDDAGLVGVIHHRSFAPRIAAVAGDLPHLRWCLTVDDGSGGDTTGLPGGEDYEAALAASSAERDFGPRSGDDLYVLYTGGTTGMPKGVVWTQEDAFHACMGAGDPTRVKGPVSTPEELLDRIIDPIVYLGVAPLMHAAGSWVTMMWLLGGAQVVLLPGSLDPTEVRRTVELEGVNSMSVVGDPVLRPLLDAWDDAGGGFDVSSLFSIGSGGAPMTAAVRERVLRTFPNVLLTDGYGSSETGIQAVSRFTGDEGGGGSRFVPSEAVVLDEDTHRPVEPGSGQVGRVARTGRIPLRYHNDPEKTAATFVTYDGKRWSLTGDMATVEEDGSITLLGRGSLCINTGGEKVYPEEVEAALRAEPSVYDVVVVGVPDERWGQAVTAVVQPTAGTQPTEDDLREACRTRLAGYKVPKRVVLVDEVVRSPAGKADYRWAVGVAQESRE